jgi:hypothetical protein
MLLPTVVLALASAWAQTGEEPSNQGKSGEILAADLQNAVVNAEIDFSGQMLWSGDGITRPWFHNFRLRVQIGAAASMRWSIDTATRIDGNWGERRRLDYIGTLGRADGAVSPRSLALMWALEGNSISWLRVFDSGGRMIRINVSRDGDRWTCSAVGLLVREEGSNPRIKEPQHGGYYELIDVKQVSSVCHMIKS